MHRGGLHAPCGVRGGGVLRCTGAEDSNIYRFFSAALFVLGNCFILRSTTSMDNDKRIRWIRIMTHQRMGGGIG